MRSIGMWIATFRLHTTRALQAMFPLTKLTILLNFVSELLMLAVCLNLRLSARIIIVKLDLLTSKM